MEQLGLFEAPKTRKARTDWNKVAKACKACGITFYVTPAQAKHYNREHCSQKCRDKTNSVTKRCEECGKSFTRKASAGKKQTFCSTACARKASTGFEHTEATRLKMSKSKTEKYASGLLSVWNKGLTLSSEIRAKFSEAQKKLNREGYINPRKGTRTYKGYRYIKVDGHPKCKKNNGYVPEHIIIAEKALGRYLEPHELVHHLNGIKWDNRNTNLLICEKSFHHWLHARMCLLFQMIFFDTPDIKGEV